MTNSAKWWLGGLLATGTGIGVGVWLYNKSKDKAREEKVATLPAAKEPKFRVVLNTATERVHATYEYDEASNTYIVSGTRISCQKNGGLVWDAVSGRLTCWPNQSIANLAAKAA